MDTVQFLFFNIIYVSFYTSLPKTRNCQKRKTVLIVKIVTFPELTILPRATDPEII